MKLYFSFLLSILLMCAKSHAADFTINVQPAASSVSDSQVSSISLSKISDKGSLASKNSVDYNSSDIINKPSLGILSTKSFLLVEDIPDLSSKYALNSDLNGYVLTSSLSAYVQTSVLTSTLLPYAKISSLGSLASQSKVTNANIDPSSLTSDRLSDFTAAVQAAVTAIEPVGTMKMFAGNSAPTGYALCHGQALSRSTYSSLFAIIGILYGPGDGSTTFNLPNTQGIFLRGAGSQNIGGIDYSGTIGSTQNDQLQDHRHSQSIQFNSNPWATGGNAFPGDGNGEPRQSGNSTTISSSSENDIL
jgi:hypothetical protein